MNHDPAHPALRRAASLCLATAAALSGCRNPSVGVTLQPFLNTAAVSTEAVKYGVHVGDVHSGLFGMEDVACVIELEYSRYGDPDGGQWRYWRAAVPVVSLRPRRPGGRTCDAFKGWPALSATNQREFLGLSPRRWALLLGLSAKGLDSDEGESYLFVGPYWGFGSLWSPKASPCGIGYVFEFDTGIDVHSGRLYAALSVGLWVTIGRSRRVPFTTEYTLEPEPPLPPEPEWLRKLGE